MIGEVLADRYVIERRLGKQAGRQTLLARDNSTQQPVVVKLLTFGKDLEWDDFKLFQREAETLQTLSHPAIPRYLDSFELDTRSGKAFALVQSYIEAKSLEEHLSNGRTFTETEVKVLAKSLLEILTYLHGRQPPVIHRDIKPSNILLTNRSGNSIGQVYLVDFGSVQTLATQEGRTVTVVGTYGYMPPEQFGGRAVPASDLYSLGATLIALLTRLHPADLPQKDMRIEFEQHTNLSSNFAEWLQWMTEPSLEHRLYSAKLALESLKSRRFRQHDSAKISYYQVSTSNLLWNSLWRNTLMGMFAGAAYAGIYGTFIIPIIGTIGGLYIGGLLGLSIGFINGILVANLTHLFFSPLTNPKLHRLVVSIASTAICTAASIIILPIIWDIVSEGITISDFYLISVVAPSAIAGMTMGVIAKSIARWYQQESQKRN